jgi:hypothetical protein
VLRSKPEIRLTRKHYREPKHEASDVLDNDTPVDLQPEFLVLAHEYGHFLSWRRATTRERWEERHAATLRLNALLRKSEGWARWLNALLRKPEGWARWLNALLRKPEGWARVPRELADADKALIEAEEADAWRLGREFIPADLLEAYDVKARLGVHAYRRRFGLDPMWPGDEDAEAS